MQVLGPLGLLLERKGHQQALDVKKGKYSVTAKVALPWQASNEPTDLGEAKSFALSGV